MDLTYMAHQSGYTRLNGPWYHLPALFLQFRFIRNLYIIPPDTSRLEELSRILQQKVA